LGIFPEICTSLVEKREMRVKHSVRIIFTVNNILAVNVTV